ncbi:MAG: hypothetical protein QXE79_06510 [Candidatus Bathyarchaeia archaeon]
MGGVGGPPTKLLSILKPPHIIGWDLKRIGRVKAVRRRRVGRVFRVR